MSSTDTEDGSTTVSGERIQVGSLAMFSASSPSSGPTQLATGLGGAIGSDFRSARNHLLFVEFNGKVSRLSLIPSATTISTGTGIIQGTYQFDFDTGTMSTTGEGFDPRYDVWWRQMTSTTRQLVPSGGAQLARLGPVSFNALSYAELINLPYGTAPIDGSDGAGNRLTNGTVFAVRTSSGNYAKVQVLTHGYNLQIRWVTYRLAPAYRVLGTGYNQPEDIKVSSDERHAYVTERSGNLLRVDLTNANRSAATVIASGLTAPHQLVLDESGGCAFLVEFAPAGRLLRVELGSGTQTVVGGSLERAIGLLVTQDRQFAYVSEQTTGPDQGRVSRIHLATGHHEVLVRGLTAPFFMTWSDPGESGILIAERDPANRITRMDLSQSPVSTTVVVPGTAFRPSSVAVVGATTLLVCCDQEITRHDLTASVYRATGHMLLGIGHVPADRIGADGYADTTPDPGYFFQVKDAPFGGVLPVMFNHQRAYEEGARFYRLFVGPDEPKQSFTDYRWNTSTNRFQAEATNPSSAGYYRVRGPGELWYHHWLGYLLDTRGLTNGVHKIEIRLFGAQLASSEIGSAGDPGRYVKVRIDNTAPRVAIDTIRHNNNPVSACAVVSSGPDAFTFDITAHEAEGHLQSWRLVALWGDNRSKEVDADSYAAHASPTKQWTGPNSTLVPMVAPSPWTATVPGDPTSRRCAHTFHLSASSRAINGWGRIHHVASHKSITLMLP